jgi:Cu/Zn superoxide dismutase
MKRIFLLASVAILCSIVPATVLAQMSSSAPDHLTIVMSSQNGSGEYGTVSFLQRGPDVVVYVEMLNPTAATQPVHIHDGTCAKLNPKPKYPLTNLSAGSSSTTLQNVTLAALLAGPFAVNVHKSPNEVGTYVACGNITQ